MPVASLDSEIVRDGDAGFIGFRSRPDPLTLPEGIAQLAENMRFVRGRAEVRRGIKRLADDINLGSTPLTLPFALAADIAIVSITRVSTTATVTTATAHGQTSGRTINIRGADQAAYNGDFVMTSTGANTFTMTVAGSPTTPATGTMIFNAGPVVRDSYTGGIFAAGVFSSPKSNDTGNGQEWIVLAGDGSAFLWRDGESPVEKTYPGGQTIENEDTVELVQAFDQLFLLRSRPLTGAYARQSVTTLTSAAGTATLTKVGHGYAVGDRISVEGADQAAYNQEFDVATVPTADTLTFAVSFAPVSPATGTITMRKVKPPLVWDGGSGNFAKVTGGNNAAGATYSNMRSTSTACYFNNQLVLAPTPAQDTVTVSDVLDYNTYDPVFKAFRANAGSSDRIVALHAFAEGDVLVFMRSSIYRAHIVLDSTGQSISPQESFIQLITSEVGCRAKNTVVTAGAYVYFLADQGVYRLDSQYTDVKVRGVQLPLSDPIADILGEINEDAVGTSTAVWFDNRYWIAIPTGTSELPNVVLVFNVLNNEWESVDSFPTGMHTLLVSEYANRRRLFAASRAGKLFLLEEQEAGDDPDRAEVTDLQVIAGRIVTRRYWQQDPNAKRWTRLLTNYVLDAGAGVEFTGIFYDPDQTRVLGSNVNEGEEEDYADKINIRTKAHSVEFAVRNTNLNRFTMRTLVVEAVVNQPAATTRRTQ